MFSLTPRHLLAAGMLTGLAMTGSAHAGAIVTIDTSENGVPTQGFAPIDLSGQMTGTMPFTLPSGDMVSFPGVSGNQGVVNGSAMGLYAAPIIDSMGTPFQGNYFSTGDQGYIDIKFTSNQMALALLWGSVDTGNAITFLFNGVIEAVVTGSQIDAGANGFQGYGGSFYTLINLNLPFNEIELSSSIVSFEGAEFEADQSNFTVPEPATFLLLGASLLGLALVKRRAA